MTTEPRDPSVRRLVMQLLESAPPPPPFPDVSMTAPDGRGRGPFRRRRVLAAALGAIIVVAAVAVLSVIRPRTSGRGPATSSTTVSVAPVARSAPDVAFVDRRGLVVRPSGSRHDALVATGRVAAPRWSPSGHWLAYRSDALWVVRADGSDRTRLAWHAAPGYFPNAYAWSPTVDALAVVDGSGVRVWWFTGTSPRSVLIAPQVGGASAGAQSFAWSRGGTSLAIAMERRTQTGPGRPQDSIWLATGVCTPVEPVSCSRPRGLRRLPFTPGLDEYPLGVAGFASDNTHVLIWADSGGSSSIEMDGLPLMAVPIDGGPTVTVANMLVRASWVQPSPGGTALLVVRSTGRMVTDTREVDVCATPSQCRAVAPGRDVQTLDPAWSPDGTHVAFVREDHASATPPIVNGTVDWTKKYRTRHLWIVNAGGSGAREITAAGGGVADPQFSPDGTSIVYVRDAQLWQLDLATGHETMLSGSLRTSASCTFDDCLPDAAVYETTSLWSDHFALHFPAAAVAPAPTTPASAPQTSAAGAAQPG